MDAPILRIDRYRLSGPHSLPAGVRVALEITRGQVQRRIRPVRGRIFLIGTASDCDLVIGDLSFPEAYAYLFVHESSVTIRRLGSGPELAVCGERVESAELVSGDAVDFGPFSVRVLIESPASRHADFREPHPSADDEVSLLLGDIRRGLAAACAAEACDESPDVSARSPLHCYRPSSICS